MKTQINSTGRILVGFALIFSLLIITSSCTKTSDIPGANEVFIQGMAFTPSTITVSAGTTITWTNKDGVVHNVTSNTGIFSSGTINPNQTFSQLFSVAGNFPYKCTLHPTMTGTVVVN
jgi:plastocyanin